MLNLCKNQGNYFSVKSFHITFAVENSEKMKEKMRLIKRLQELQMLIITANDVELNKVEVELAEIEKKLITWTKKDKHEFTNGN